MLRVIKSVDSASRTRDRTKFSMVAGGRVQKASWCWTTACAACRCGFFVHCERDVSSRLSVISRAYALAEVLSGSQQAVLLVPVLLILKQVASSDLESSNVRLS